MFIDFSITFIGFNEKSILSVTFVVSKYVSFKVAHLDFSEAHHPNFKWLILYCLSLVGQGDS